MYPFPASEEKCAFRDVRDQVTSPAGDGCGEGGDGCLVSERQARPLSLYCKIGPNVMLSETSDNCTNEIETRDSRDDHVARTL